MSLSALAEARRVLRVEARAVRDATERLGESFSDAVRALDHACLVVVCGVGKSGHIARKLAGTFTATGTPAVFLHPTEAVHGDLGIVVPGSVLVVISRSGECDEVVRVAQIVQAREHAHIVALTTPGSRLALASDFVIDCSVSAEACPLGLAPTASTAVAMAVGDALASCLTLARGATRETFLRNHPGGALASA